MEKMILGTVQFGTNYGINNQRGQPSPENVFEIFEFARHNGILCLDTAEDYGSASQLIGDFHFNHLRDSKFGVISKISHHYNERSISKHLEYVLSLLKVSELEGYLFHSFAMYKNADELWNELLLLKDQGLIRKVGVSIYTNEQLLEVINDDRCDIIQLPLNLLDNLSQKGGLLQKAKDAGKEIHARSVYLQGLFFMDPALVPERLRPLIPYLARIKKLAEEASVDLMSLALQYIYSNDMVDRMLIGVDSIEQLSDNIGALGTAVDSTLFKEIDNINVEDNWLLNPVNWK